MGWFSRNSKQKIFRLENRPTDPDHYPVWTEELEKIALLTFADRDNFVVQFELADGRSITAFAIGGNYQGLSCSWQVRCLTTELNDGKFVASFHFYREGESRYHPDGTPKLFCRPRVNERVKGVFGNMDELKTALAAHCSRIDNAAEKAHRELALKFTPEKVNNAVNLRARAECGDADAQYSLSQIYLSGEGVKRDKQESLIWLRKAAEQGHLRAQWLLGFSYEQGLGVGPDMSEAARWFRLSAEGGDPEAQIALANLYEQGEIDDAQNFLMATYWFQKAAEQGHPDAQCNLARIYEKRQRDLVKAFEWYRKAAEQGNSAAAWRLGRAYYEGDGVTCNKEEALRWYSQALAKKNFVLRRTDLTDAELKLFGHLSDRIAEPGQFI